MGVLKDIVEIIKSEQVLDDVRKNALSKKYSSLASRASEGTMQFPTLVSDSLDIETLQMITKALERNYSTFLQTVLTMNSVVDSSKNSDIASYLKQFHQNISSSSTNDLTRNIIKVLDEYAVYELDNGTMLCETYNGATTKCSLENSKQLVDMMESLRSDVLNDKFIPNNRATVYNFRNKETSKKYNNITTEADNGLMQRNLPNQSSPVLKDNDVKKANELIATTLHVRLHLVNKDGTPQATQDFIAGVKAVMHIVKSNEMIENMVAACKNNDAVFNFFRWTTGEISFFRDFWLNTSEMKRTVGNESRGASRWWNALKKRRSMGKVSDTAFVKNKILPNATIVMSADEAEIIKSTYGYDVYNPFFMSKIMDAYYLLGFVIVDVSSQIAHFYFDGDEDYQSVSFSGLERESGRDERKFKEMLKTINRM